jgi:hypothetical protein
MDFNSSDNNKLIPAH